MAALTGLGTGMGAVVCAGDRGPRPRSATFAALGAAPASLPRILLDT